jgi:hypothetical protein
MICTKTVTEKTLAANRLNAKRSTGPRTERGKNTSKFNAVRTGLFAKHVAIPVCDGEGSEKQFARLLADLRQEFQPEGLLEEFYVGEIAKSIWRLRRATRAEKGSARYSMRPARSLVEQFSRPPDVYEQAKPFMEMLSILQSAKQEIKSTGTLSPAAYTAVLPILKLGQGCVPQPEGKNPSEPKIDDHFLVELNWQYRLIDDALDSRLRMGEEEIENYHAIHALPPEETMNKILRYETAAEKEFDWALQKLLESQQRRQKARAPVGVQVSSDQ